VLWALTWFIYALGYHRGWRDRAEGRPYWSGAAEPPEGPGGMRQ